MIVSAAWIVFGGTALAIWAVLYFARGRFWDVPAADGDIGGAQPPERCPRVTAIIPARNEAATIGACVESLLAQQYEGELSVIVADDHSEDGTARAARAIRAQPGRTLSVVAAGPLPAGWTGKLWALNEAVRSVAGVRPEYFWFTDADVTHAPDTLARLVARAESGGLDLASLMVLLRSDSFAERLLIPAFLYFFLALYPPRWTADSRHRTAGAAGGCVLLRAAALRRIGGLEAIRQEVIDDCALARAIKRSGGRIWMGVTLRSASLRGYGGFAELRDMVARTAFTQLNYSALALAGTIAAMLVTFVAPLAVLFSRRALPALFGAVALLLMFASYLPVLRYFKFSPARAVLLPPAAMWYSFATCVSAMRYWRGRGGQWKGRVQARPRSPA